MLGWFKKKFGQGKPGETGPPQASQVVDDKSRQSVEMPAVSADAGVLVPAAALPAAKAVQPSVGEEKQSGSFLSLLKERLAKTHETLVTKIDTLFLGRKVIDAALFEELEEILISADLGVKTSRDLLESIRAKVSRQELSDTRALRQALKEKVLEFLLSSTRPAELCMPDSGPFVIMVLGVNGVGKTTSIGKIAYKFKRSGQSVLLVAADTFRAAAIEQLQIWGTRVDVEVIAQKTGADPSSVIFDAFEYARNRAFDVIIVDTAGRMHTKVNLMEELKKIKRVMDKRIPGAPHEVMLVIDATTGQNAISQARLFNEAVEITGLTLTKLDGTAKGGIVVNICHELNIPIRFIGVGEKLEDLRDFDPREFVEALFATKE